MKTNKIFCDKCNEKAEILGMTLDGNPVFYECKKCNRMITVSITSISIIEDDENND